MASICTEPNGRRRIVFHDAHGKRRTIRLGKTSLRGARQTALRIENLVAARTENRTLDSETSDWLKDIGASLRKKLAAIGLVNCLKERTLGPFMADYIAGRVNLKASTVKVLRLAEANLLEFFGADVPLREISAGDAADFREALKDKDRFGLSESTARKRCSIASQIFRYAIKHQVVSANPFDDVPKNVKGSTRRAYVSAADAEQVLDALPNNQWKLLFALSRWGGLRVGSEVRRMSWGDVDWESNRLMIHSPKTEHHEGRDTRLIPMFPELAALLRERFEDAEEGETLVLPMLEGRTDASLRATLQRAIKNAGVKPWTRLWHSLRASRQTDLTREFPAHVVCDWLGNTEKVARENYLSTTDEDFRRATSGKVARNAARSPVATARNSKNEEPEKSSHPLVLQGDASICEVVQTTQGSPGGTRTPDQGIMSSLL